ncbi:MAG: hypothetical protein ABMA25_02530 [Ilumatobacteraceae bacterium]
MDLSVAVPVAGGELPSPIVSAQLAIYGATLDPAQLGAVYHVAGLPYPAGDGVILIEHQQIVSNVTSDGASRFDSVTYAFLDPRADGEIIEAFATATGLDVAIGGAASVVDGTCTEGDERAENLLRFIACTRDDGSHSLQVVREQWVAGGTVIPDVVQQQLEVNQAIVVGVGGELYQWDLRRDIDYPSGHALSIDYNTPSPVTVDELGALLPGWSFTPDDGYGPGYVNGAAHWYITDTGLLYSNPAPDELFD